MYKIKIVINAVKSEEDEKRYKAQYTKANDILKLSDNEVLVYGNIYTSTIVQTTATQNDLKIIVDMWTDADLSANMEISKDVEE